MRRPKGMSRDNMKKGVYILPNLFTTASMFFGFFAMLSAIKDNFEMSAIFIMVSMVLDGLDGRIARMTNTTSKFGVEYDSLADVVAFGVAPAVMIYKWALEPYGNWGMAIAFLLIACGALRLARFNVQVGSIDSRYFNGLPIPLQAVTMAASVLFYYKLGFVGKLHHPAMMIFVTFISLLMVSSIKFYSFKDLNFFARKPLFSFVLIIATLAVIVSEPQVTVFAFCCGYIASGPIFLGIKLFRNHLRKEGKAELITHQQQ